jgi:spore germination protein GerM
LGPILVLLVVTIIVGCTQSPSDRIKTKGNQEITRPPKTVKVVVYYPAKEAIFGEDHFVSRTDNLPLAALKELFQGKPLFKKLSPILPQNVKILSVTVKDGLAVVNFSREILDFKVDKRSQELALGAIVQTLTEFPNIRKVKFLVEGKEKGTIAGQSIEEFWGAVTLKQQPWQMK